MRRKIIKINFFVSTSFGVLQKLFVYKNLRQFSKLQTSNGRKKSSKLHKFF